MMTAVQSNARFTAQELQLLANFRKLSGRARNYFSNGLVNVFAREHKAAIEAPPRAPVLRLVARRGGA